MLKTNYMPKEIKNCWELGDKDYIITLDAPLEPDGARYKIKFVKRDIEKQTFKVLVIETETRGEEVYILTDKIPPDTGVLAE